MRKQSKKIMAVGVAGVMTAALLSGCATRATLENLLRTKNMEILISGMEMKSIQVIVMPV